MTDDGVLQKPDPDVRFPRRKAHFHIFHLLFFFQFLFQLISFEPNGPCSPLAPLHLSSFQTGKHSTFKGGCRQKLHAIIDSAYESLPGLTFLDSSSQPCSMLSPCYSSWITAGITSLLCFILKASSWLTFSYTMLNVLAVIHRVTICHSVLCIGCVSYPARSCSRIMDSLPQTPAHTQGSCPWGYFSSEEAPQLCVLSSPSLFLHCTSISARPPDATSSLYPLELL